jgi:glutamate formiminotransferase
MNLVNYKTTGIAQAYDAVKDEATRMGVEVFSTEIVGLVPKEALDADAEYFKKLENLTADKILENRLQACE